MKLDLYTKFERNRTIRGGVIAISVFDLMTLNIALRVALSSGIIFIKFDLPQLIYVPELLTLDPLTLKVRGTLDVT